MLVFGGVLILGEEKGRATCIFYLDKFWLLRTDPLSWALWFFVMLCSMMLLLLVGQKYSANQLIYVGCGPLKVTVANEGL